jgi:hypothetical protein
MYQHFIKFEQNNIFKRHAKKNQRYFYVFIWENYIKTSVRKILENKNHYLLIKNKIIWNLYLFTFRELHALWLGVVSHIPKFGDASKSPSGDVSSPLEMRILRTCIHISRRRRRISRWRCGGISKLRDMWHCWRCELSYYR